MCVHHMHSQESEEGIRSPGTKVVVDCELPCGYWESSPGPPQEQYVLVTSDSFLQHPFVGLRLVACIPC